MADLVLGCVTSIIDATLAKVISATTEQINLAVGWKEELERLQRKLAMIRAVLLDADEKQVSNQAVRRWLEKLREVAREAEDVLDEVDYERLKHKVEIRGQMKKKVGSFFTSSNPIIFRQRMATKIKDLITSIDEINKEAREYNLQSRFVVSAPESRSNPQTAHPFLGYRSQVMGREDDVSNLVNLLIDSGNKQSFSVISVVGMGGLGKTTLVRSVAEAEKIRGHFGKIMSVCVSEDFDVKRILQNMVECLTKKSCSLRSESALMEKIKEEMENKNYLLILDDVWNENELMKWEELRGCLLEINKNKVSRVVVTTRSKKAASIMGTRDEHVYHLKELKHDDCWSIIKQRVFGDTSVPDQELEKIGRQIAKKCRGVPLVANIIGASLSTRIDRHEWLSVQNFDAWDSLKDDSTGRGILGVLQSSFDRLPNPALKQCFAFCSIFPKDFVIERDMLVQLWMAGSFLQPSEGSSVATLEDIGDKYFDDLLSYSLFQEEILMARRDSYGRIMYCKMHDLIHDLATTNSKSETLILNAASGGDIAHVRHLNLFDDMEIVPANFEEVTRKLHALFLKSGILCKLPGCFKRLRILSLLGHDGYFVEQLPTWIGKMKHLRFLDISRANVKELPQFIMKLYSLQTLRFEFCGLVEKRPEGMETLVNLKHIYFTNEKCMPVRISGLADLQTLPWFFVGQEKGSRIEELGSLSQLRGRLIISCLEFVDNNIEAKKAKLCEKTRLHELVLKWSDREECKHDEDVLEGLQPPSNVRSLDIDNYGGEKCPSWMGCSFNELFLLCISRCKKLKCIPTMKGFSALQELYILECFELIGIGDDVSALLTTSLRRLKIMDCPRLQTIGHSLSGLTCLEELDVISCRNLRSIPSMDGLSSLKILRIQGCDGLVSLPTGLSSCTALQELYIEECFELTRIGDHVFALPTSLRRLIIMDCPRLQTIGHSLSSLTWLEMLRVSNCRKLRSIPIMGRLSSLKTLIIEGCDGLMSLLTGLSPCTALQKLCIEECFELTGIGDDVSALSTSLRRLIIIDCPRLQTIGRSLCSLSCLEELSVNNCRNLRPIPSVDGISSLKELIIQGTDGLVSLPTGLSSFAALKKLSISACRNLISIPDDLMNLHSLIELRISHCRNLRYIPEESLGCLVRLQELRIGGFSKELEEFPGLSCIQSLNASLQTLTLIGWETLKYLPPQIQHLTSLRNLYIFNFNQVEALPEWLGSLSSLQILSINGYNNLKYQNYSAEAMQRLSKLQLLNIHDCPELKGIFAKEKGPECSELSHAAYAFLMVRQMRAEFDEELKLQFEDFALIMSKFLLDVGDFVLDGTIFNSRILIIRVL